MTSELRSASASANLGRTETAERAAVIDLHRIRVELDVTAAPDPAVAVFPTVTTLEFDARADATWIDFIGDSVGRVEVNGTEQPVRYDGARIRIGGLGGTSDAAAAVVVRVEALGVYSRSGEGLHRYVDPADGETYLYTQYEPADARRVMACFEQPDLKAETAFSVRAPEAWTVLSNTVPAGEHAPGAAIEFAPTKPISSYITAVAAGPYFGVRDSWTKGDGSLEIPLGVYCRASLAEHLDADEILEVTKQGLDFFHERFGFDYPWGVYDQIFVPEYNLGAMENPGLVTFTESYVFRGAATESQREGRANTILHEMAHMWFGDLVTMRWWDDLWLKESFADFMGAFAASRATRFTDAFVTFANRRKAWAVEQDQMPTTHPIVADIPDLEAAKLNFDGITYAKGAAVLKQLVAFVGEDAFFAGARRYFADHAYGNTELNDLLVALEEASGRDLRAWSAAWLETTGLSTLELDRGSDAAEEPGARILMSDPRPHRIAVGGYALAPNSGAMIRRERVELDLVDAETPLPVDPKLLRAYDLWILNDEDLSYAKVRLDAPARAAVTGHLSAIDDPLARGLVWSALWNATRDGELPAREFLAIVAKHAGAERNVGLLETVLGNAALAVRSYVRAEHRVDAQWAQLELALQQLDAAEHGSGSQLVWARAFAAAAERDGSESERVADIMRGHEDAVPLGLALDADLRWRLLTALVATGHAGEAEIATQLASDDTGSGRAWAVRARASVPDAEVRLAAWERAWNDLELSNEHLDATIAGARAGGRDELLGELPSDPENGYFARILPAWQTRSIEIAKRLVLGLFPEAPNTDAVDAWLDANADAPGSLRRLVIEQRDRLARRIRVRAAQSA
ncbi:MULTISPECIES: aminopeptidase N [unclassified Leucobacter]|uniref:aminopeptidase N n=1 Tax=unclassified Leucobacter TaxID=2621730 RepID=UPI000621B27E|nr:aminopeptidase N [Leucobacter sp. Ag1]KKI22148.1 aminopeptidase N [Leucobacter sp. Ag1]